MTISSALPRRGTPIASGVGSGDAAGNAVLPARSAAAELVPFTDRMRYMQLVRLAGAAVVLLAALVPGVLHADRTGVALSTAGYLALAGTAEAYWRLRRRRGLPLFNVLLLADGLYVAWVGQLSGGMASDLRFLLPLFAVAATLLASYRTGLKSALWSTLVLYTAYRADRSALLPHANHLAAAPARAALVVVVVLVWVIAFATAVFSSVNERELRRRRYDLQALSRLSRQLERETQPTAVAAVTLDALAGTYAVRRGLVLASTEHGYQVLAATRGEGVIGSTVGDSPLLGRCSTTNEPVLLRALDPAESGLASLLPGAQNLVVLPLHDEQRCTGVVLLERGVANRGRLERRTLAMMEQFSAHAALALRRAWLLDELRRQAETDGLTGLANRRTFDTALDRECSRAGRAMGTVSLLLIDIDHFKRLNDTHGHQAGDEVLQQLGAVLRRHARPFDTPARYGGEEFAIILPDCSEGGAVAVAERIRAGVAAADTVVPITVSVGAATYPGDGLDASALVRAADAALYASKRAGRNRVTSAPTEVLGVHHG